MIKLSIIIPAYNAEPYIHELLDVLEPQVTKEIQTIVIDDGSEPALNIERKWVEFYSNNENKGISFTRNRGLELAKGKVIHFIDADDLVPKNYVSYMLEFFNSKKYDFDYIDLSWKSLDKSGVQFDYRLKNDADALSNPSASTRMFKRDFIGDHRFSESKDAAEDEDFTRHLQIKKAKHVCVTDYMYFYRTYVPNSNSKRFISGECNTYRVGYYYKHFIPDMTEAIERIKEDDKTHEVLLLTDKNDVPEIEEFCRVYCPPQNVRVMETKGESCKYFNLIPVPVKADIVIWTSQTFSIGGIETFIYNFVRSMSDKYKIVVVYDTMAQMQIDKVSKYARCVKNNQSKTVVCDTLIVNRITDKLPPNFKFNKVVQMVHCIKQDPEWHISQARDAIVCVSKVSKESFGDEGISAKVINNLLVQENVDRALVLVSATRIGAKDKGKNDDRMRRLARLMKRRNIKFIWLYWGQMPLAQTVPEMVYMGVEADVRPYIKMADYLVQLSDCEAFSYSLLESLCLGTPLIVTPLKMNKEMKIKDGVNAYVVPFDFDDSYDVERFKTVPKFNYKYDNQRIIQKWVDVIEKTKPTSTEFRKPVLVKIKITYKDLLLDRMLYEGEIVEMEYERAEELINKGFIERALK